MDVAAALPARISRSGFFRVKGGSGAEKSRLARATVFGVAALPWNLAQNARRMQLMVPGDLFSSLLMLCYCVLHVLRHFVHWNQSDVLYCSVLQCYGRLHVLRYFVHWNWCITAMCFTVVCCNSIVFSKSVSADRNGMAASSCLERYLVSSSVLRLYCFASRTWQLALELLHHGRGVNARICTKHCDFFG